MNIPRSIRIICFSVPWIALIAGVIWLLVLRFPPSGVFSAKTNFNGKSAWILPFLPGERVSIPGLQPEGWTGQKIINDPVYFTARVPGPYDTVTVDIDFRSVQQPIIEFGVVRDAQGKNLEMRPLFSSELNDLKWREVQVGSVHGFVPNEALGTRLTEADTRGLAVWHGTSSMPLIQDVAGSEKSVNVSLRGAHDFYIVPTDTLKMTFFLQAVNRKAGTDLVSFRVFRGEEEVYRDAVGVNGSRDTRMGQVIEHQIEIPKVSPGVYHISVLANDDVFIRKIVTPSIRWVVGPRLSFGDVVGYATSTLPGRVWTNSRHAVVETFHVEGLQQVVMGLKSVTLQKTHTSMRIDRDDDIHVPVLFQADKGDVKVIGDGFFSWSPEAFFEPIPRRVTDNMSLKKEHIQAVVTSYVRPTPLDVGWLTSRVIFSIDPKQDTLRFVLSAPGVLTRGGAIDIRKITLTYARQAWSISDWLRIIKQELVNVWHRL